VDGPGGRQQHRLGYAAEDDRARRPALPAAHRDAVGVEVRGHLDDGRRGFAVVPPRLVGHIGRLEDLDGAVDALGRVLGIVEVLGAHRGLLAHLELLEDVQDRHLDRVVATRQVHDGLCGPFRAMLVLVDGQQHLIYRSVDMSGRKEDCADHGDPGRGERSPARSGRARSPTAECHGENGWRVHRGESRPSGTAVVAVSDRAAPG